VRRRRRRSGMAMGEETQESKRCRQPVIVLTSSSEPGINGNTMD